MSDAASRPLPLSDPPPVKAARMMPKVRHIAHRLARRLPAHVDVDDLIGAGCVGLADALRKYDRSRSRHFEAYASFRIKGAMVDELRASDPLSRDLRERADRFAAAVRDLSARLGRAPDDAEVARHLRVPLEAYLRDVPRVAFGGTVSLDTTGDAAEADEAAVCAGSRLPELPDEAVYRGEVSSRLKEAIDRLPDRLRTVLVSYYEAELTLREIGLRMGVTESRVCQLHAEAIARLRDACERPDDDEKTEVRRRVPTPPGGGSGDAASLDRVA